MAKLAVKKMLIFGASLTPSGNIEKYGSYAAGAADYSNDPDLIQTAAWLDGLAGGLLNVSGGQSSPVLQDFNGILYVLSYQLAKSKQDGLLEWDASVEYYAGSWAQVAGVPYVSQANGNSGNDPTSAGPTYWKPASEVLGLTAGSPKAWVVFDGRTGAIDSNFNVASVVRTSAGTYTVNFAVALASALYGFAGSAGTRPGVGFASGDDNEITGGKSGLPGLRSAAACQVFCLDRPLNAAEDSSMISVVFFGP